jgi:hypothetical protein
MKANLTLQTPNSRQQMVRWAHKRLMSKPKSVLVAFCNVIEIPVAGMTKLQIVGELMEQLHQKKLTITLRRR